MPFTYYLYHIPTDTHYYGARWAKNSNPDSLWTSYFSSSRAVHNLIDLYGKDSFVTRVMRIFDTGEEARLWESKFLRRVRAVESSKWINKNCGQPPVCNYSRSGQGLGRKLSESHRKAISAGNKGKLAGRNQTSDHIALRSESLKGRAHTTDTKKAIGKANRYIQPIYTFTHLDGDVFRGRMYEWAAYYSLNIKSASTVFCAGKAYKGWARIT